MSDPRSCQDHHLICEACGDEIEVSPTECDATDRMLDLTNTLAFVRRCIHEGRLTEAEARINAALAPSETNGGKSGG